jgi:hypothetical protein
VGSLNTSRRRGITLGVSVTVVVLLSLALPPELDSAAASSATPSNSDPGKVVLADGFESGAFSRWSKVTDYGNASVKVGWSPVHSGSRAALLYVSDSSSSRANLQRSLPSGTNEVWADGWFNILNQGHDSSWSVPTFRFFYRGQRLFDVSRQNGSGAVFARYPNGRGGWTITQLGYQLSLDRWHHVKIHLVARGSSSVAEVWIDGAKVYYTNHATFGVWRIDLAQIGAEHDSQQGYFAADDVVIKVLPY